MMATMPKVTKVQAWLLRYTEGSSDKFYNLFFFDKGPSVVHWGRWGQRGQSQIVSSAEAQARFKQKIGKGYRVEGSPTIEIDESQFSGDAYDLMLRAYRKRDHQMVPLDQMAIFVW